MRLSDDPQMPSMVEVVLPRTSAFARESAGRRSAPQLIAANIDTVLIVPSLNADLNRRRIERYLVAARAGGAEAVVVLNKADLIGDAESARALVSHAHVAVVSALRGSGLDEGEDVLDEVYDDIAELARSCRFHDCGHQGEPGCAVQAAIDADELEPGRLTSYHKLQRELAGEVRRRSRQAQREHGRRWGEMIKKAQKLRRDRSGKS